MTIRTTSTKSLYSTTSSDPKTCVSPAVRILVRIRESGRGDKCRRRRTTQSRAKSRAAPWVASPDDLVSRTLRLRREVCSTTLQKPGFRDRLLFCNVLPHDGAAGPGDSDDLQVCLNCNRECRSVVLASGGTDSGAGVHTAQPPCDRAQELC